MYYALGWIFVTSLIGLWSLAVWALQSVAVWAVSNAGALTGAVSGAGAITLPDWLAPWVPLEVAQWARQLLAGLGPVVESVLQAAPALAGGVTVTSWVVWGIGSMLLVVLGVGLHLLIMLWRRRNGRASGAGSQLMAGLARWR